MACDSPLLVVSKMGGRYDVPCGKCPPCKLRRVQGWVFRMQQEEKRSTSAHFVTLTYDTLSVPITQNGFMTLDKTDVQKFFKRLRKILPQCNIKYYIVGEYGGRTARPHYHAIIFNVSDVSAYSRAWSLSGNSIGTVHVGRVSGASIAYTLKYIDKPPSPRKHARDDRAKEFSLMSKDIGSNYVTSVTKEYHNRQLSNNFLTELDGKKIALPRYYRQRLFDEQTIKEQTQFIIKTITTHNHDEQKKFHQRNPGTTDDDYRRHLDEGRLERYRRFYHRQKQRD